MSIAKIIYETQPLSLLMRVYTSKVFMDFIEDLRFKFKGSPLLDPAHITMIYRLITVLNYKDEYLPDLPDATFAEQNTAIIIGITVCFIEAKTDVPDNYQSSLNQAQEDAFIALKIASFVYSELERLKGKFPKEEFTTNIDQ